MTQDNQTPKMQAVADAAKQIIKATFLSIHTDDNLMSSVIIRGSHDPHKKWHYNIFQNSRYFIFHIKPMNGYRYYNENDPKVTVQLLSTGVNLDKFRKYTGPVDKVLAKIQIWIEKSESA